MDSLPRCLDCEASSFAKGSYPISVAWSDPSGSITRCLINPSSINSWTDWDERAEAAHGIDRQRLCRNGWPPDYVVERLTADLQGSIVYTDAPEYDARWLTTLFQAVLGKDPPLTFAHIDDLLIPLLRSNEEMIYEAQLRLDALKDRVRFTMSGAHDAGYDVGYLLQLYRAASGKAVKMNHGIGPLPTATNTGTFVRLKSV